MTPDETELFDDARRRCAERFTALADAEGHQAIPRRALRAMGEAGLIGRLFPARYNGVDIGGAHDGEVSAIDLCILREALACESSAVETAFALQGLGSYPILQSGTPQTVARWMPGVCAGTVVPSFAMSEPGAGSDAAAMSLAAERVDGGWSLTGTKTWISNAPDADVYTVFARTTPGAGARGVTAFCVPGDAAGLSGEALDMLSPHPLGTLHFDGVFVPDGDVLGEVDRGFQVAMRTLDLFRPSVGAFAVGMAQAALEMSIEHATTRQAFGGPLVEQQAVAHMIAEMAVQTQAARLMVRHAARVYDAAPAEARAASVPAAVTMASSMAKLFATEAAQKVVDTAVQIHGARALVRGHRLEALYRDVRAPRIYEGASEVQRTIIARHLIRKR